jgi:hypothetical protein
LENYFRLAVTRELLAESAYATRYIRHENHELIFFPILLISPRSHACAASVFTLGCPIIRYLQDFHSHYPKNRRIEGGLSARKLAQSERLVIASPAYLARRGVPATPADVLKHDAIIYSQWTGGEEWSFAEEPPKPQYAFKDG